MSVLALARDLIAVPSRGGIDDYGPVAAVVHDWLTARGLPVRLVKDAVVCEIDGGRPGPAWVLDACLDTAPFGDETAWTDPPTSAVIRDGWLHGRGSADSKTAVAIFCHLGAQLAASTFAGRVVLLFDLDEHTGGFGGARTFFDGRDDVAGVLIGYPGLDTLVIGGRGVRRAELLVYGEASHSGARRPTPNAVVKAADLVRELAALDLGGADEHWPGGAKLTVTAVHGGSGYSVTPDLCVVDVDIRTTTTFDGAGLLEAQATALDARWPGTRRTLVRAGTAWPAYALGESSLLRRAMLDAAASAGLHPRAKAAGPSNIGNYLAGLGIPATAGFGVEHEGLHGIDERIRIDTIPLVQAVYHSAVMRLTGVV